MKQMYENGRITIPKEIRERNNLKPNDLFEVYERGNEIIFKPMRTSYTVNEPQMSILRKLYMMIKDTDILEESEITTLKEICGFTEISCPKCGEFLYLTADNTYKCMKCGE